MESPFTHPSVENGKWLPLDIRHPHSLQHLLESLLSAMDCQTRRGSWSGSPKRGVDIKRIYHFAELHALLTRVHGLYSKR